MNLEELPKCHCGKKNWKEEGIKIFCGECGLVLFKGFPKGSGKIAICTDRAGHNIDDGY